MTARSRAQLSRSGPPRINPAAASEQARAKASTASAEGARQTMREVAVYKLKNGAIVEERFLPFMAAGAAAAAAE